MATLRSTLRFVVFIVAIMLFLVGGASWIIGADQDYSVTYERVEENVPGRAQASDWDVGSYGALDEQQRQDFQRAVDGEVVTYENDPEWPDVIEKDDRYYVFSVNGHFDWFDPGTFGPLAASLVGLVAVVLVARDEHREY
ncbi:hypothetical protein [Halomarina oriensis]|uniref:Uncharacterized protein n=1 Tax=Halomarina oriensis TaxID=671145 RepID=A0A6B0GGN4_9EURY|nr:hypothetical protein [Halomarina oriensis]MWG34012.1 hypothetical protein [Halomarina oriensis]